MAEELKIRVSLDNQIYGDLRNLEKRVVDFSKNIGQKVQGSFNFGKIFDSSIFSSSEFQKLSENVSSLKDTIGTLSNEIKNTFDTSKKNSDEFFDNVFVGLRDVLGSSRGIRLRVGKFFGDSKSSMALILNDAVKLADTILPFLVDSAKAVDFMSKTAKESFGENSPLTRVFGATKLPILSEIRLFFEQAKIFFGDVSKEIRLVANLIASAFGISRKEFNLLEKNAIFQTENLKKRINGLSKEAELAFQNALKSSKSFSSKLFDILLFPFTAIFKTITTIGSLLVDAILSPFRAAFGLVKDIFQGIFELVASPFTVQEKTEEQKTLEIKKKQESIDRRIGQLQSKRFANLQSNNETLRRYLKYLIDQVNKIDETIKNTNKSLNSSFETVRKITNATKQIDEKKTVTSKFFDLPKLETFSSKMIELFRNIQTADFSNLDKLKKFQFGGASGAQVRQMNSFFRSLGRIAIPSQDISQSIDSLKKNIGSVIEFFRQLDNEILKTSNQSFSKFAEILEKLNLDVPKNKDLLKKSFDDLFKSITGSSLKSREELRSFGSSVTKTIGEAIKSGDKSRLREALLEITNTISLFVKEPGKKIGDSAKKIPEQIGKGVRSGYKDLEKTVSKENEKIMDYFPQSPAKKGPLKNLFRSGIEIVSQLMGGFRSNIKVLDKTVGDGAEQVASYFPRSLAKLGPLKNLIKSGAKIPEQLAFGIIKNLGVLSSAAQKMASVIVAPFKFVLNQAKNLAGSLSKAIESTISTGAAIGDISRATGTNITTINKLDSLFRQVGSTAKDNAIVFSRLQKTLNDVNPERESRLASLGVDLDEIRNSADPVISLFTEMSEVLANVPPGSDAAKVAIESLGLTINNKLVGVLREGGDEVSRIINESSGYASSFNSQVVKASLQLRALFSSLSKIFDAIKGDFVGEVLPVLRDFFKDVVDFFNKNSSKIRTFVLFLGRTIANLIRVVIAFFKLLVSEPKKAIKIAKGLFLAFFKLVKRVANSAISNVSKNLQDEIKFRVGAVWQAIKDSFFDVLKYIGEQIDLRLAKTLLEIENNAAKIKTTVSSIGSFFLKESKSIFERWIVLGSAVIQEILVSAQDSLATLKDNFDIFILDAFRAVVLAINKYSSRLPKRIRKLFGLDSVSGGLSAIDAQIKQLQDDIKKREEKDSLFERASKRVSTLARGFKTVDEQIDKINQKIKESNEKLSQSVTSNFDKAFSNAEKAIKAAREASGSIFDTKALEEYKKALDDAKTEMIGIVEGTELEGPIKKLISELSFDFIGKLKEMKDNAVDQIIKPSAKKGLDDFKKSIEETAELFSKIGEAATGFSEVLSKAYEVSGEKSKELFYATKAAAIAEATINGAVAFTQALKNPFPLNIIMPPLIAAKAGLQVGLIARQTIKGFAEGGRVPGGEGGGDIVPAMLTPGEFVMPLDTVKNNGLEFMEGIRNGLITAKDFTVKNLPNVVHSPTNGRFANGGAVPTLSRSMRENLSGQNKVPEKKQTFINVPDKEMVGRYLSTEKGQDLVINVISDRAVEIKSLLGSV